MISVHLASCVEWLAAYDGPLFDSCVTDPPYHLSSIVKRFGPEGAAQAKAGKTGAYARASKGFMGQQWDGGDVAFQPETWRAVYDALKPGAHLVAFSGTRTYHRMACAIEDAGFEIRDQLAWTYGSGFPKSHNAGDGWGTALKPAWEPICLARKPLIGTVAANVQAHGTGAINIDGCRVGAEGGTSGSNYAKTGQFGIGGKADIVALDAGRWPANILHDGSDEVLAGFPDTASGQLLTHHKRSGQSQIGTFEIRDRTGEEADWGGDSGSAARFFYSAKAGPLDRIGSKHATVKPVDLMRWLVRLVTPKGGHVLEPFAGSGTTGIAAMAEGFDCTMIELMPDHVADIERKLAYLRGEGAATFVEHNRHRAPADASAMPLFGDAA